MAKSDAVEAVATEAEQLYQRLGLSNPSARARFAQFVSERPQVTFRTVITTTSDPFTAR